MATTAIPDLWPENFGEQQIIVPVAVLRQQAHALKERTKGLLIAEVESDRYASHKGIDHPGEQYQDAIGHDLKVYAPLVGAYEYLVRILHEKKEPYPARIYVYTAPGLKTVGTATKYEEVVSLLHSAFTDEIVTRKIRNLLAQSLSM